MPDDFNRQPKAVSFATVEPLVKQIFDKHPFIPGVNHGKNNFIEMPNTPALMDFCGIYQDLALRVIPKQYPKPTGQLKQALNKNLDFFYGAAKTEHNCTQVFPYGRD